MWTDKIKARIKNKLIEKLFNQNDMKNLNDYLHLYTGCKVEYEFTTINDKIELRTGRVWGIVGSYCHIETNYGFAVKKIVEVKPILKRTTNMTDPEIKAMPFKKYPNFEKMVFTPEQTIYLLKLGFDLFGLIDAGLAIDKDMDLA